MSELRLIPYQPARVEETTSRQRLEEDLAVASARRSVRMFSTDPVPRDLIETAVKIAGTAPSGAHQQPWQFVLIRERAEVEEREFYERRAPKEWLEALAPLGTDFEKEHIVDAPWLIVVFRRDYDVLEDGTRLKHYYMTESVGIAVGFLIQALHRAGLATLTHTPSPMTFLREICERPLNEKPFVLMPVGYPAEGCEVPDIRRKELSDILTSF
jgi:iodotyrosine deiodinase